MGAPFFLAGSGFNLLSSATLITPTSENTLFPKANLSDGDPGKPFRFNADAANVRITVDHGSAKNVNICAVFGHNLAAGITAVEFRSSTDNFAASDTLEATLTFTKVTLPDGTTKAVQPAFYAKPSATVSRRYSQIRFVGTNGTPIEIGELVFGLTQAFGRGPNLPYSYETAFRQKRATTPAGRPFVTANLSKYRVNRVPIAVRGSESQIAALHDSIFSATEGGVSPTIYAPDDAKPQIYFGLVDDTLRMTKVFTDVFDADGSLTELPFSRQVT